MANKDKELRKMSRSELIEIIYAMQQREADLRRELDEAQALLDERTIVLDEAGSIAQAALGLNKVFEAAQAAADQYVLSVKNAATRLEASQTTPQALDESASTKVVAAQADFLRDSSCVESCEDSKPKPEPKPEPKPKPKPEPACSQAEPAGKNKDVALFAIMDRMRTKKERA